MVDLIFETLFFGTFAVLTFAVLTIALIVVSRINKKRLREYLTPGEIAEKYPELAEYMLKIQGALRYTDYNSIWFCPWVDSPKIGLQLAKLIDPATHAPLAAKYALYNGVRGSQYIDRDTIKMWFEYATPKSMKPVSNANRTNIQPLPVGKRASERFPDGTVVTYGSDGYVEYINGQYLREKGIDIASLMGTQLHNGLCVTFGFDGRVEYIDGRYVRGTGVVTAVQNNVGNIPRYNNNLNNSETQDDEDDTSWSWYNSEPESDDQNGRNDSDLYAAYAAQQIYEETGNTDEAMATYETINTLNTLGF
ncbi:MAG: hypothetical protein K6G81_11420 [Lachnospiraceae bacterium]|nr:hypothetical protein [Lachnospiraceae bacterium]